jgi:hypothetical protein
MKKFLILALLLLSPQLAYGQAKVFTLPSPITSQLNNSATIAVTNTFQPVFVASTSITGRTACTIQNTGTNPMYVYFGLSQTSILSEATIANSIKLSAGQAATCNSGNIVIKTPVWITGTATETYYAAQQ